MKIIDQLREQYPTVGKISIGYFGSGDSFDSFHDAEFYDKDDNLMSEEGLPELDMTDGGGYSGEDSSDLMSVVWKALEAHPEVDFNNDGCEGEVIFDLVNDKVRVDNRNFYTETSASPEWSMDDDGLNDEEDEK